MSSEETPRTRPRLEVALEVLGDVYSRLVSTSQAYKQARVVLEQLTERPDAPIADAGLLLLIGELQLPLPMPTNPQARLAMLDDAVQHLGIELVRLWGEGFRTCEGAVSHCNAAAKAAAQGAPGT